MILVVDDNKTIAEMHAKMLKNLGFQARVEIDSSKVNENLDQLNDVSLVLLDLQMPKLMGIDLLKQFRLKRPDIGIIIATIVNDIESAVKAVKAGAFNYLAKPLNPERLKEVINSYLESKPRNLIKDPTFSSFVTSNPVFENILMQIKYLAKTDSSILIQGETGTGKDLIAQLVHRASPQKNNKFLKMSLNSIPSSVFAAELFGTENLTRSGGRSGCLDEVSDGTLLLDEIGDLPIDQQLILLRLLETKTYNPIDSTKTKTFNGRLIFTTNCNLTQKVEKGDFRSDLFYRLSSSTVLVPPLRDRKEDINLLIEYFLKKYSSQYGKSIDRFSEESIEILNQHSYPGNVRELESIVNAAVLLEESQIIRPNSLPQHIKDPEPESITSLKKIRQQTILKVLAENDGNQTKAAKQLGIARGTLNRLLQTYRKQGMDI